MAALPSKGLCLAQREGKFLNEYERHSGSARWRAGSCGNRIRLLHRGDLSDSVTDRAKTAARENGLSDDARRLWSLSGSDSDLFPEQPRKGFGARGREAFLRD